MKFLQFLGALYFVKVVAGRSPFEQSVEVVESKESVKLTLFYSSFCKDCGDFITKQLYKTWLHFEEHLKLELVPVQTFWLLADLLEACAIQGACGSNGTLDCSTANLKKAMDYLICMEEGIPSLEKHLKCAPKAGLDLEVVNKCATSDEGVTLQKKYNKLTKDFTPPIKYIPTIVINDKYDEKEEKEARKDLMKLISSILK